MKDVLTDMHVLKRSQKAERGAAMPIDSTKSTTTCKREASVNDDPAWKPNILVRIHDVQVDVHVDVHEKVYMKRFAWNIYIY